VLHSVTVDGDHDVLAAGSWAEIAVVPIGSKPASGGYTKTKTTGDVTWIGIGGGRLVAAVQRDPSTTVFEVRALDTLASDLLVVPDGRVEHAALSRDGRYLAVALRGSRLAVYDLDRDLRAPDTFHDHSDSINYVRFADDHLLVSADCDNRVVLRPRTPSGYNVPLVDVELPPFD
jgi:WD40 repeat protein